MTTFISFARRQNQNATIDSICTRCYQTIASASSEGLLIVPEQAHLCNPNGEHNRGRDDFNMLAAYNQLQPASLATQLQARARFPRHRSKQTAA